MSGNVVGDDYDKEIDQLEHITKNGVWILDCLGEDDRKRDIPDWNLIKRGFEYLYYLGKTGGDIYRYRKQVVK